MNCNVNKGVTLEIFKSIPQAKAQRAATENYEKVLNEEAIKMAQEVRYQIEKASRSGQYSTVVEIRPNEYSAWSVIDLKYYMKSILMDLGYKVRFPSEEIYKFIIEW
jgi:hypothetical protein